MATVEAHQTRAWAECLANLEEHWARKLEALLKMGTLKTTLDQMAIQYLEELTALRKQNPTEPELFLRDLAQSRVLEQNPNPDEIPLSKEAESLLAEFVEKWEPLGI